MSSSNYNMSIFTVATEIMGEIKRRADSKVSPFLTEIVTFARFIEKYA